VVRTNDKQGNKSLHSKRPGIPKAPKKNKQLTEVKILYANANGIGDKMNSIQSAAELYGAHIIAITETKQIPPKVPGFGKWIEKQRRNRAGGEIAIAVRQEIANIVTKVDDLGEGDQEIVWIEK
jgi:hypothetical protein